MRKFLYFFLLPSLLAFADEIDLSQYEKSVYSQNGEDGVLAKIFQVIGTSSKFCVELGSYEGTSGSNTYLFRLQGWNSLALDRLLEVPEYNLHKEFITAGNINQLFEKYSVPSDLDLLSIDIDYNDFHIWKAIDGKYRPAVVVIDYNATHLPSEDKVVKYHPYFCGDWSTYYGASILALYNLGKSKGYSLVYAERAGVNLFFIREDILREKNLTFKDMDNVEKIYRYPAHVIRPQDPKARAYLSSVDLLGE